MQNHIFSSLYEVKSFLCIQKGHGDEQYVFTTFLPTEFGETEAEPIGPWCVWVSLRLERKAWSAGEFVGTGGTGQVRKGSGKVRFKNLKKVRMKLKPKMDTEIKYSEG